MSARIVVTLETLKNVNWVPAQAVFEQAGRTFVYARNGDRFVARDVKLIRRGESRVVVGGVQPNEEIALASPDQKDQKNSGKTGGATPPVGGNGASGK